MARERRQLPPAFGREGRRADGRAHEVVRRRRRSRVRRERRATRRRARRRRDDDVHARTRSALRRVPHRRPPLLAERRTHRGDRATSDGFAERRVRLGTGQWVDAPHDDRGCARRGLDQRRGAPRADDRRDRRTSSRGGSRSAAAAHGDERRDTDHRRRRTCVLPRGPGFRIRRRAGDTRLRRERERVEHDDRRRGPAPRAVARSRQLPSRRAVARRLPPASRDEPGAGRVQQGDRRAPHECRPHRTPQRVGRPALRDRTRGWESRARRYHVRRRAGQRGGAARLGHAGRRLVPARRRARAHHAVEGGRAHGAIRVRARWTPVDDGERRRAEPSPRGQSEQPNAAAVLDHRGATVVSERRPRLDR